MNTSQIKNFAVQSRQILMAGVLNRLVALGFDVDGSLTIDRPVKIQGGTVFMGQLREESLYEAWTTLEGRIAAHGVKAVCEEAAYTWFNRLVAIRIMQKNGFIEPVMQYVSEASRIPMIVDEARSGRLSLQMSAFDRAELDELLRDSTKTNEQFNLLISAFCEANPVIYNCFGGIEKYIKLLLPDNILAQGGFIDLLNNTTYLTDEDYKQSELIGWLYQFYISEKKDEVFDSFKKGKKAEADDIPAATQIFTPNWIVKYMVQNTLGRIYLDNNPYSTLGDDMKYLVKTDEPTPEEAILHLDDLQDYKMIDPACGSGHILVEAFDLLYAMYQDEAYPTRKAIELIFTKNIIGIDLDTRAKQLATFALLMKACMKDRSFLDCKVMPRVLDMPEPFEYVTGDIRDFLPHYFLGGDKTIIDETAKAFELLKQAKNLGSIMKFDISAKTRCAIERATTDWERQGFLGGDIAEAVKSMNIILALTDKYTSVVANPPYMGGGNMNLQLKNYVSNKYEEGKSDLYSVFMIFGMERLACNGKMGMINMQTWMFQSSFEHLRLSILQKYQIDSLLHLGPRTFDELSGEVVQNASFVFSNNSPYTVTKFYRLIDGNNCAEKEALFLNNENIIFKVSQSDFSGIPGMPLGYWVSEKMITSFSYPPLSSYLSVKQGTSTGDNTAFLRLWHEVSETSISFSTNDTRHTIKRWYPATKGGYFRKWYGNNEYVVDWQNDGERIRNCSGSAIRNPDTNFIQGLTWGGIGNNLGMRYCPSGFVYLISGKGITGPINMCHYVLGFTCSKVSTEMLRVTSPGLSFEVGYIASLSLKTINNTAKIEEIVCDNINLVKKDWDAHETSWDFKTNELLRMRHNCGGNVADLDLLDPEEAEEIMAKYKVPTDGSLVSDCLAAYKSEWARNFHRLHYNEEELNRQFIEIYGLQDELKPDVPLDEITILQQGEISIENNEIVWHDDVIIKQLLSYAVGCWMGRYRLDMEGLHIAHYPTPEEVCSYDVNGYAFEIDDDAIIPLMGKDTPFEDDNALQKIINFVKMTFGEDNLSENLNYIEHCLGKSIEDYLIKDFWKDHKKMYQNRPIYWLFSSKKGAFQVVTYMHRMNPYTVEKIRTKYLLPYIEHLKGKIEIDEARGSDLTTVERKNLSKMKVALDECIEYHDRLHDVALKAIDFDLDDGVVVNYAKFGDVLAKIK